MMKIKRISLLIKLVKWISNKVNDYQVQGDCHYILFSAKIISFHLYLQLCSAKIYYQRRKWESIYYIFPSSLAPQSSIRVTFISIDYNTRNILGPISLQRDYWVIYYSQLFMEMKHPANYFAFYSLIKFLDSKLVSALRLLLKFTPHYSPLCSIPGL